MAARALLLVLAFSLSLIAPAMAQATACTDGVNCLCDNTAALAADSGASILMCEDFESSSLNDGDTSEGSDAYGTIYGDGWATTYPEISDACLNLTLRRCAVPEDSSADCDRIGRRYRVRVSRQTSEDAAVLLLLHEAAHVLVWSVEGKEHPAVPSHDGHWGLAYARLWRDYMAAVDGS